MLPRRRMLQSSATLLAGGVVGATAVSSIASESAAAQAGLQINGDEVTIRGDTIAAVTLDLTVPWSYEVPSGETPETLAIDVRAGTSEDDLQRVAGVERQELFLQNNGEERFEVGLLAEDVLAESAIVPDERGAETTTEVVVGVELQLIDDSEFVIAADSVTDTATVGIEKDDYDPSEHGDVSGSGSITISVE